LRGEPFEERHISTKLAEFHVELELRPDEEVLLTSGQQYSTLELLSRNPVSNTSVEFDPSDDWLPNQEEDTIFEGILKRAPIPVRAAPPVKLAQVDQPHSHENIDSQSSSHSENALNSRSEIPNTSFDSNQEAKTVVEQPRTLILHIWDCGGQAEYYPAQQLFVTGEVLFLLAVDINHPTAKELALGTLLSLRPWSKNIILVLTKCDKVLVF
jgi:hypothetical protein